MMASGPEPPRVFVGRESQLEELERALDQCKNGCQPRFVLISGDVGVGKTALVEHFLNDATPPGSQILVGRGKCALETEQNGLVPFAQILGTLAKGSLRGRIAGADVLGFIREVAPAWLDIVTLGITSAAVKTVEEGRKVAGRSKFTQDNVFVQYCNALPQLIGGHPAICFIDDLHWADTTSLSLLFHVARNLADCAVLFICTYRTGETQDSETQSALFQKICSNLVLYGALEIELIQGIDVAEYVSQRYPSNLIPHPFVRQVQEITQGHPLFVSDRFLFWEETHAIVQVPGIGGHLLWALKDGAQPETLLPATLGKAVAERLGRLEPIARKALDCAAVEGEAFTAQIVECVLNQDEIETYELLETLEHRYQLVSPFTAEQEEAAALHSYRFVHRFYREFIYASLQPGHRAALHRRIGACLEKICSDSTPVAAQLAFHFGQAGDAMRSALYSLQAAKFEYARWAWAESEQWCAGGLAALERMRPTRSETRLLKLDLVDHSGRGFYQAGDYARSAERFRDELALAVAMGTSPSRIAAIYNWLATISDAVGRLEECLRYAQQGLAVLNTHDAVNEPVRIELQTDFAGALDRQGRTQEAVAAYDTLLAAAVELEMSPELKRCVAAVHNFRGIALGNLGLFAEAAMSYRHAIALSQEIEDQALCSICWLNLAYDAKQQGHLDDAEKLIELAEPPLRLSGAEDSLGYARALRGAVLLLKHRAADAEKELIRAIERSESLGANWNAVDMYADLALARVELDRVDDARHAAEQAMAIAEDTGDPMEIGTACIALGRVETAEGRYPEALTALRRACAVHAEAGHRHLAALAQGYLGQALSKAGDQNAARVELAAAIQTLKDLDLDGNAQPFRKLLGQVANGGDNTPGIAD